MIVINLNNYTVNNDVTMYAMEDGAILLNVVNEDITVINEMGVYIWNLLCDNNDKEITIEFIIKNIILEYDVSDVSNINDEIFLFLKDLINKQILLPV